MSPKPRPPAPYTGPLLVVSPAEVAWIHEHASRALSNDTTGRALAVKCAAALGSDPKWRTPLGPA